MKKTNKKILFLLLTIAFLLFFSSFYQNSIFGVGFSNANPGKVVVSDVEDYPLFINITSDRESVKNDGRDSAVITVAIRDTNGYGVAGINVKFRQISRTTINPLVGVTDNRGVAVFTVSSTQIQVATFKLAITNPYTGEVYNSNAVNVVFLNSSGLSRALTAISDFRNNPITKQTVTYVMTPAVSVLAGFGAYSSLVGFLNSIIPYLNYLFDLFLKILGIRRRQKPWGVIYDSMTKEPVSLAIARLFSKKTKNIIQTVVTDKTGRFGFGSLSGSYYLEVTKYSYLFPSKLLKGASVDGKYTELYFGGDFSLKKSEKLAISIPIDQETAIKAQLSLWDRLRSLSDKLSLVFFVTNLIIALILLWVNTNLINEFLVIFYLLMIFFKKGTKKALVQSWGVVFNSKTGEKLSGIPIKLFDKKYDKLRETKISDEKGRFNFILPKGEYYLRVGSFNYALDKSAKPVEKKTNYKGESFKVEENEVLGFNIPLKKLGK